MKPIMGLLALAVAVASAVAIPEAIQKGQRLEESVRGVLQVMDTVKPAEILECSTTTCWSMVGGASSEPACGASVNSLKLLYRPARPRHDTTPTAGFCSQVHAHKSVKVAARRVSACMIELISGTWRYTHRQTSRDTAEEQNTEESEERQVRAGVPAARARALSVRRDAAQAAGEVGDALAHDLARGVRLVAREEAVGGGVQDAELEAGAGERRDGGDRR